MSAARCTVPGAALTRTLLIGLLLAVCAAGGFLLYRASTPRPTLHAAAAAPTSAAPAAGRPSADAASGPRAPAYAGGAEQEAAPAAGRVPERLPELALPDREGVMRRLSEFSGRSLLINFWATWCEPCRREIPLLETLRHERARDGLQVVGIALDTRDAVLRYAAEQGMDYPVLVGERGGLAAVDAFGMDPVLPFSVFADRNGRVVALKVGELHRNEADFILDRIGELDAGRLSLPEARAAISGGMQRLSAARRGSPEPTSH